jgi:hypothetical protein
MVLQPMHMRRPIDEQPVADSGLTSKYANPMLGYRIKTSNFRIERYAHPKRETY